MATMEGPLSKWTNVMKGWQYRWFVLDENSGLLSYYTSKEKMMRGSRRGCVRLKGAVIGIDDEDDSTFTITVDQKTFHFQARDADEKEKWIEALDNTIMRHGQPAAHWDGKPSNAMVQFDKKLAETDAYLQILIEQVKALGIKINQCEDETARQKYNVIKVTAEAMIESIKQAIVTMQISKQSLRSDSPVVNGHIFDPVPTANGDHSERGVLGEPCQSLSRSTECIEKSEVSVEELFHKAPSSTSMPNLAISKGIENAQTATGVNSSQPVCIPGSSAANDPIRIPALSYSSSEDEDFYDAEDGGQGGNSGSSRQSAKNSLMEKENEVNEEEPATPPQVIASQNDVYDELYDDTNEEELDSLDQHGSVITYLLSQVRIGMDLTKIVLPTFILEKRSLLEMYADFLAHPDYFIKIADFTTPYERFVQTVRWYMSAFHAGRKSPVAKKPYNPILGETFLCYYDVPNEQSNEESVQDGPVPWATKNNIGLICEQVSHHPPISAFYAEHYNKRISLDGYIWTKSKFLGLSIGVHMIGQAVISVLDYDEEYIITFPNGYGRSILTVPWVEMGGKVSVTCPKTGYYANIEFLTKPFYGGKKDKIRGELFAPNEKKPFCNLEGEWNGIMYAKYTNGLNEVFVDTKNTPIVKKLVRPTEKQGEYESRKLWRDVTYNLKSRNMDEATAAKHRLEQRQREEAKDRKERGAKWETKFFHEVGEHWVYDSPLVKRLAQEKTKLAQEQELKDQDATPEVVEQATEAQPALQETSPPDTADEDSWQEAETELAAVSPSDKPQDNDISNITQQLVKQTDGSG